MGKVQVWLEWYSQIVHPAVGLLFKSDPVCFGSYGQLYVVGQAGKVAH
jgi:hypothetical protein